MRSSFLTIIAIAFVALLAPSIATAEDFNQALASAYLHNPKLKAERARVRETDENYVQAQAAGRFTVNANGSIGRTRSETVSFAFIGGASSHDFNGTPRSGQLSIVQPLYQGGRVQGLKAQARAGVLAARQGLRNTEQNILLSAATAYSDVIRDEEAAIIRRNNVRVLVRHLEAARDKFNVGEGTLTDIAQAKARLAQAEAGLANADAQLAISRASYVRFVGHIPEQLQKPPQFVLPKTVIDAQAQARRNNPQMLATRYNEYVAQAAIHVAKAAGRPTLSLSGTIQGSRDTSSNILLSESATISAQVRVPIYQGGFNQSRVRAAKHARIRSKFETRETELVIDQAVANLWAQVDAATRTVTASKKQIDAAEIAYEGVQLEQEVGTRNTLDVLNAEQELLDAKLAVVQAERNLRVAEYQLIVTMGGFDSYSLQLPVQIYDPKDNFDAVSVNPIYKYVSDTLEKIAD
ncbi:MAG: TolC family outer membrane protein [Robiginitomaculum sp.]